MSANKQVDPKLDAVINQMTDIVKPLVTRIEQSHPTTKDHYGDYMSVIARIAEMVGEKNQTKDLYLALELALQRAGANKNGVRTALYIMRHTQ